ncbi:hypothetical protein JYG38_00670 [Pseudomonas rhodesiae]|uniref:hypothetical protein n=1 Tax=Pseudomonas rhodesiae TaxID=76760 RepID=UPI001BCAEA59|nr:hypothetical protein [Pseudomonas rhodesiae]QVN02008.1 hypothetical protein JYG38_00670 [Pseudomonas rhodesiae]
MQRKMKSAQHHWWPRCVSKHWADEEGFTNWLSPDGNCKRIPHAKLGMIGNGHHIKFNDNPSVDSPFDTSFEKIFDEADREFPSIINWLSSLNRTEIKDKNIKLRFIPEKANDEQLRLLTECAVSLAVRSPMNREASVSIAESFRGPIPTRERNALIGLNMRNSQRMIADSIGCNGKFAILFTESKEFIFGDGIFNNISGCTNPPHNPKILVALTPNISVIISRPISYSTEPRISTITLNESEVNDCNNGVQVYSKGAIFFRNEKPTAIDDFVLNQHRKYDTNNPLDFLINSLPGVNSTRSLFY